MNKGNGDIIVGISAQEIYQHPDNPRKDLGDLTELAESIKKNGIMQNLTVIPGHWLTEEERQRNEGQKRNGRPLARPSVQSGFCVSTCHKYIIANLTQDCKRYFGRRPQKQRVSGGFPTL